MQHSATKKVQRALFWFSVALALAAWGKAIYTVVAVPTPARDVRYVTASGPLQGDKPRCHGSSIADGRYIWQICDQPKKKAALIRFDLGWGLAEMRWPLGEKNRTFAAATADPDGALTFVAGQNIYRALAKGGLLRIGRVRSAPLGMAWVAKGRLELVDGRHSPKLHAYVGGKVESREIPRPPTSDAGLATLELAYRSKGSWRFVFARVPRQSPAGQPVKVPLFEGSETEPPKLLTSLSLPETRFVRHKTGAITLLTRGLLDRSAGNALVGRPSHPPFERVAGHWKLVEIPGPKTVRRSLRILAVDYHLERKTGQLTPIYRTEEIGARRVRISGRWLTLLRSKIGRGVHLRDERGERGRVLTSSFWIYGSFKMLPATGGYWIQGGLGEHYIRVSAAMWRADPLSLEERIGRLFVDDRAKRNSDLYNSFGWLKKATVPFVLFFLPVLLVVGFAVNRISGRERKGTSFWITLPYVVGCGVLGYWFWRLLTYYF